MRCTTCKQTNPRINGDGPTPCRVMLIGEAPGREENAGGRPFIGQSGRELNEHYLRLAGLKREDVYLTNTVKCHLDGNRTPNAREIAACSGCFLGAELKSAAPEFVVLMGSVASSLAPDINLEQHHGLPLLSEVMGWRGTIIPMYHPALGLHNTTMMQPMIEDWERLGKVLAGTGTHHWPKRIRGAYNLLDCPDMAVKIMRELFNGGYGRHERLISIDTETVNGALWSIQFSEQPHTAWMIRPPGVVDDFADTMGNTLSKSASAYLHVTSYFRTGPGLGSIVFHHALADMPLVNTGRNRIYDTMQMAYHLGLPQKLKVLAYRVLGLEMRSYEDVVMPHSRNALLDWLTEAILYTQSELTLTTIKSVRTNVYKSVTKPHPIESALKRIQRHTLESDTYDPWEKLASLKQDQRYAHPMWAITKDLSIVGQFEDAIHHNTPPPGPFPTPGIHHVPIKEAVDYGCADADATRQLYLELKKYASDKEKAWGVVKEDWD